MAQSAKLQRVFKTLRVGRRFRKRPAQKHVQDFLRHLSATGEPHSWATLSTTSAAVSAAMRSIFSSSGERAGQTFCLRHRRRLDRR